VYCFDCAFARCHLRDFDFVANDCEVGCLPLLLEPPAQLAFEYACFGLHPEKAALCP
jgi:hypothetical protein